jgi:hypothetical protein
MSSSNLERKLLELGLVQFAATVATYNFKILNLSAEFCALLCAACLTDLCELWEKSLRIPASCISETGGLLHYSLLPTQPVRSNNSFHLQINTSAAVTSRHFMKSPLHFISDLQLWSINIDLALSAWHDNFTTVSVSLDRLYGLVVRASGR